ncbi:glycosyltransferase family 2 protein [Meridianimaribacter sp. CL38]|uniref:glycosyltransferase family 2 protein n=1 Tax=Meridianimaribacter sp. CL38 TaxID=2213021 RepID=UPI00103BAC3E|nr:glycosyltransferase family 2 protein [Meridianimaribacter sp. CL38]TBV27537.1 glycosyltransferase family 2 protein [Meridianimaribacter sp. CL38]
MKLSVVILNYNVQYFLESCLKSVQKAIDGIEAEIIVVDNNSSDRSCDMVKTHFPDVVLIENKENSGFSKGNNIGVSQAKGEYLCVLNPDTIVAEDTFKILLEFANGIENLGILGCRLVDGTGHFLPESKRNIPKPNVALKKLLGKPQSYYATQIEEEAVGEVPVFVGAFMILKKEVYKEVGGFDEDYFMYGEDVDLSYKVLKAGYDNYYNGNTTIIHYKGESTLKDLNYAKRFYGAMQIFYKKHFKSNFIFNSLVWLGIRGAYLMRSEPLVAKNRIDSYTLVSKDIPRGLKEALNKPITQVASIDTVEEYTEIIFDAEYVTYKSIIEHISNPEINNKAFFKILPKNANFIIGSNSSKNRGEVIHFKKD